MILEFLRGSMSCPVFDPLVNDCPKSVKVAAQPFPSQKHLSGLQLARNCFEAFWESKVAGFRCTISCRSSYFGSVAQQGSGITPIETKIEIHELTYAAR